MSIYGTWLSIEHPDQRAAEMAAHGINYSVIGDDSDERELGSPIVYQGSHVLPSNDDRRGGSIDVAAIPAFIEREDREKGPHDWLRLSVDSEDSDSMYEGRPYVAAGRAVVVLDRRQVQELSDTLVAWLAREEEIDALETSPHAS